MSEAVMSSEESPQLSSTNIIASDDISEIPKHVPDTCSAISDEQHMFRSPDKGKQVYETTDTVSSVTKDEDVVPGETNFGENVIKHISDGTAPEYEKLLEMPDADTFVLKEVCTAGGNNTEIDFEKNAEKQISEETGSEKVVLETADLFKPSSFELVPAQSSELTGENEHADENGEKIKSVCASSSKINPSDYPHRKIPSAQSNLHSHTGAIPKRKKSNTPIGVPETESYNKLIIKFKRSLQSSSNSIDLQLLDILQLKDNAEILMKNIVFRHLVNLYVLFGEIVLSSEVILSAAIPLINSVFLANKKSRARVSLDKDSFSKQSTRKKLIQINIPCPSTSDSPSIPKSKNKLKMQTSRKGDARQTGEDIEQFFTILGIDRESKKEIYRKRLLEDSVAYLSNYDEENSPAGRILSITEVFPSLPRNKVYKTATHSIKFGSNFKTWEVETHSFLTIIQPCITHDYKATKSQDNMYSAEVKKVLFSIIEEINLDGCPAEDESCDTSVFSSSKIPDQDEKSIEKSAASNPSSPKLSKVCNPKMSNKHTDEEKHQKQKPRKRNKNKRNKKDKLSEQLENKPETLEQKTNISSQQISTNDNDECTRLSENNTKINSPPAAFSITLPIKSDSSALSYEFISHFTLPDSPLNTENAKKANEICSTTSEISNHDVLPEIKFLFYTMEKLNESNFDKTVDDSSGILPQYNSPLKHLEGDKNVSLISSKAGKSECSNEYSTLTEEVSSKTESVNSEENLIRIPEKSDYSPQVTDSTQPILSTKEFSSEVSKDVKLSETKELGKYEKFSSLKEVISCTDEKESYLSVLYTADSDELWVTKISPGTSQVSQNKDEEDSIAGVLGKFDETNIEQSDNRAGSTRGNISPTIPAADKNLLKMIPDELTDEACDSILREIKQNRPELLNAMKSNFNLDERMELRELLSCRRETLREFLNPRFEENSFRTPEKFLTLKSFEESVHSTTESEAAVSEDENFFNIDLEAILENSPFIEPSSDDGKKINLLTVACPIDSVELTRQTNVSPKIPEKSPKKEKDQTISDLYESFVVKCLQQSDKNFSSKEKNTQILAAYKSSLKLIPQDISSEASDWIFREIMEKNTDLLNAMELKLHIDKQIEMELSNYMDRFHRISNEKKISSADSITPSSSQLSQDVLEHMPVNKK